MDLSGQRESENVDDQRGATGRMPGGRTVLAGGGLGTLVIVLLISAVFGVNPLALLQQMPQGGGNPGGGVGAPAPQRPIDPNDPQVVFVRKVLATTEDVWQNQFRRQGLRYKEPKLELFNGAVKSACGFAD